MENGTDGDGVVQGLRVSDAERQEVVNLLREQTTAGRLTLGEFEERLDEVFSARTDTELAHALRELPVRPPTVARSASATVPASGETQDPSAISDADLRRRYHLRLRKDLYGFVAPNFVCNLIWIMGDAHYWWPGWVLLGTGLGLFGTLVKGFDPEKERVALLTERRRQAMLEIEARHASRHRHHY